MIGLTQQAKEMIQKMALKTGVSEESLVFLYLQGYCDGLLALSAKQLALMDTQRSKREAASSRET